MAQDVKKQIIDWFNGPQDYNQGIELLQRVSKKNKVIGKLVKRGERRASFEKLTWELNKVAGLKKIPVPRAKVVNKIIRQDPPAKTPEKKVKGPEKVNGQEKTRFSLIGKRDINSFPTPIQRIIRENSSLYMLRGKKQKALIRLPEDNKKETIDRRLELMDEIKKISARLEVLFEAWKAYDEQGTEPDIAALWPEESKPGEKSKVNPDPASVEDLKTQKKNIQSSTTKDRNLLLYGSKTKQEKENPVPAGPKRTKLEKRIAKKEAEILALDQQIAELG